MRLNQLLQRLDYTCLQGSVDTEVAEIINDLFCDCSVELKFEEASIGTAFARCALTVAIVNKNFHR